MDVEMKGEILGEYKRLLWGFQLSLIIKMHASTIDCNDIQVYRRNLPVILLD